jgi:hypothetical protein
VRGVPHLGRLLGGDQARNIDMHTSDTSCRNFRGKNPDDTQIDTHDLLNEATEWMQYARGLIELLAELVHESDAVNCGRMALGLEAIASLTRLAAQRTAEAHARISWERARGE